MSSKNTEGETKREKKAPVKTKGTVRSVNGGDVFTIFTAEGNLIKAQLSSIQAPRMGTATRAEEAFAWEAREFLRKKIIGQQLSITIVNQAGDMNYVNALLGEQDLAELMVSNGWCTVHPKAKGEHAEELAEMEARAREDHIGIFQTDRSKAQRNAESIKPFKLFEECKSKPVSGVVESVRSGSTLRVVLLPSLVQVTLAVAGVQAPAVKWINEKHAHEEVEPCGLASLKFVEDHVQHRDISIELKSLEKNDTFVGVVKLLGRDLGAELVKMGLAQVVPGAGIREGSEYYNTLMGFQNAAVAKKAGMWKFTSAPAAAPAAAAAAAAKESDDKFTATVCDIANSGIIAVERADGSNTRIFLASVRPPRVTRDNRSGSGLGKNELYKNQVAADGRELLRTKIFGKAVTCEKRYERPDANSSGTAVYYDVYLDGKNVALPLFNAGLVEAVNHRSTEPRSHDYDDMCLAEKRAQEKKVGLFAKLENVQLRRITDMTADANHATAVAMLPHLKNRINGVVDYVFSPVRIKVFVPSQNSYMAFICSGVQAPRNNDKDPKMVAIAEEGLRVMRKFVHMRDVSIFNVETADKGGNFIATIECNGTNLSCMLVERGLAWVSEGRRTAMSARLEELEKKAKEEKRGFWAFYVPPEEKEEAAAEKVKEVFEATVTDFGDYGTFYLQKKADADVLDEMTEELANVAASSNQRDAFLHAAPKNKQLILAQFTDGSWCRASYLGTASDSSKFNVLYVDFGTTDTCPREKTMPLPPEFCSRPPLAIRARLAFIDPPKQTSSMSDDFLEYFQQLTEEKTLNVTVEYIEDGVRAVSLADKNTHVNVAVLREGLATLNKKRVGDGSADGNDRFAILREAQNSARQERLNMWVYGDVGDDDEDENPRRRQNRRR